MPAKIVLCIIAKCPLVTAQPESQKVAMFSIVTEIWQTLCQAADGYDNPDARQPYKCQTLHVGSTHWSVPVHTAFSDHILFHLSFILPFILPCFPWCPLRVPLSNLCLWIRPQILLLPCPMPPVYKSYSCDFVFVFTFEQIDLCSCAAVHFVLLQHWPCNT